MIRIDNDSKNAYKVDSSIIELTIRIPQADIELTNDDIIKESFELKEAIESSDNLTFTGCVASSMSFECFNLAPDLEGLWIEADVVAIVPGDEETEFETVPLFRGYIDEVTNQTHEEYTQKIRAYDALYTINSMDVTAWRNALTFPISIFNLRNSFFSYIGITQKTDYLPNDNINITAPQIEDPVVTGGKIIKAICSINGRFGRISREGLFEYVHLVEGTEAIYPAENLYPDDDLYPHAENAVDNVAKANYSKLHFENYQTTPIGKVQLINKNGQIVATQGTGENVFTLKDNPLVWGLNTESLNQVAINLYNTVKGIWYVPAEVECVGLPYVECGDFVVMVAQRSIVRAYVLIRTLKGVQILTDSIRAEGDKKQPNYIPGVQAQINANTTAINNEKTRAQSAESSLNTGLNNANNRITQVNNLVAQKASISDLQAANAQISSLWSNKIDAGYVNANFATIGSLNSLTATVNTIRANYITAAQVDSKLQNVGWMTVSTLWTGGYNVADSIRSLNNRVSSLTDIVGSHSSDIRNIKRRLGM